MNKPLLTLLLLVSFIAAKAQTKNTDSPDLDKIEIKEPVDTPKNETDPKKIFTAVEKDPSFPGGVDAFFRFLQANTKYPDNAVKKRIEGKVFVTFVVEDDGSLSHIKVSRGVSPDIDAEAIRVMSHSPNWRPGIQNGRAVSAQYNVSINFKLPAQQPDIEQRLLDSLRNLPPDQKIFTAVEQEPSFPGGKQAFANYLLTNVKYPDKARENKVKGIVYISFIVERDGSLTDIKLSSNLSPEIDAEAIRLMKECPKWNPGMQNGRTVRVAYTVPIGFRSTNQE
jgi:TonB family protein